MNILWDQFYRFEKKFKKFSFKQKIFLMIFIIMICFLFPMLIVPIIGLPLIYKFIIKSSYQVSVDLQKEAFWQAMKEMKNKDK